MVRCGIALYGCSPFTDDPDAHDLRPAMSLVSYLASIRTIRSRESVGYGGTWRAARGTRVGVVPVGYADGYARALRGGPRCSWAAGGRPWSGRSRWTSSPSTSAPRARRGSGTRPCCRTPGRRADVGGGGRGCARHDQLRGDPRDGRPDPAGPRGMSPDPPEEAAPVALVEPLAALGRGRWAAGCATRSSAAR